MDSHSMGPTLPPAVAGSFYPGDAQVLHDHLSAMLEKAARAQPQKPERRPKALVVPHAGTVYSGPIAATAYALLKESRPRTSRVIAFGPAHRVYVAGLALPGCGALSTPFGPVPLDEEGVAVARGLPEVVESRAAHAREHSVEVQLPFLQLVLEHFTLVPFAVGHASPAAVARAIEALWGGGETLILISTDLSHFLDYEEGRALDARTAQAILALDAEAIDEDQACGRTGLLGLLQVAKKRGLRPRQLDLRSSGDTAGDRRSVVGYGAFAFDEPEGGMS
jgi:AmmeMemoRadiSam system protein B